MEQVQGTLLVVDDVEMNRDMLTRRLARRGYTMLAAEDGPQALELIAAQPFDLVLLDIMMPGMSGLEVLKILRQRYTATELPIIMATAKDQSTDFVEALQLGANDYVTKPLDFPVVLARVQTHLSLKRAAEDIQRLANELEQRNQFIRETFGHYVTDEVVADLLDSPTGLKLGGERRKVTILMSDLRGFTALTEDLEPERVVFILNRYLSAMIDVIEQYKGTIDDIVGDGLKVFFGAPIARDDDAYRAVACAVAMQLEMDALNKVHREEGLPVFGMGIGINTGDVVVGNLGSEKRKKYDVVGTHANLTSRIESYTVGGQVLISEATRLEVEPLVQVGTQMEIQAKGLTAPITAHEVRGLGGPYDLMLPEQTETLVPLSEVIPLQISVLQGKTMDDTTFRGDLVQLSQQGGEIASSVDLDPLQDIKMQLMGPAGSTLSGQLYAKVMEVPADHQPGFRVHFTTVPPDVDSFFQERLASESLGKNV